MNILSRLEQKQVANGLYLLFSIQLILFTAIFFTTKANNDVYYQLLATEKIISNFDFSSVPPHPTGIPIIASIILKIGFEPIILFQWISPILIGLIFFFIFFSLKSLGKIEAVILAFLNCTNLSFLKSFNQFNAEILAYFFISVLIFLCSKFIVSKESQSQQNIFFIFIFSIGTVLIRDAFIFLVIGAFSFLYFQFGRKYTKQLFIASVAFLAIFIPRIFFFNAASHNIYFDFNITTLLERSSFVVENFISYFKLIPELVLPQILHLKPFNFLIAFLLTILFFFQIKKHRSENGFIKTSNKIILLFLSMGFIYLLGMLASAFIFKVKTGYYYRISGVLLFFLTVPFWYYIKEFNLFKLKRNFILIVIILGQMKYFFAVRYELVNSKHRFLHLDQSIINKKIITSTKNISNSKDIYVYAGNSWKGRNLIFMLKYFNYVEKNNRNIYGVENLDEGMYAFVVNEDIESMDAKILENFKMVELFEKQVTLLKPYK